ncbi:MAG: OmpA family protein, partial [Hoylesella buccalis]
YKIAPNRLTIVGMGVTDKLFKEYDFNRVATFNDDTSAE